MPPISRILETALYVEDLKVAEAFYVCRLGFTAFFINERMAALAVPGGGVLLLFRHGASVNPTQSEGGIVPGHDASGTQHLCFAIPAAALGAWVAHLAAEKIAIESRVTWDHGSTSLYFRDPDGHSLELATPGLWANY